MIFKRLMKFRELILLVIIATIAIISYFCTPSLKNVALHRLGKVSETSIPISIPMEKNEIFSVEMDLNVPIVGDFILNVHPDDCVQSLKVNDVSLPYRDYPGYCSWNEGFVLKKSDITKYVKKENSNYHFQMTIKNGGGLGGINAKVSPNSFFLKVLSVFFYLFIGALLFSICSRFSIDKRLVLIFFLGFLLRVGYTQNTFYDERGHDCGGHIDYIQFIINEKRIPTVDDCWTCYHPPVYFMAGACVWSVANFLDLNKHDAIKWFDFLISLIALAFGIACIKNSLWGVSRYIASLLWCVWPSFVLASPRVGNDILFYAMHIIALWGCIRYIKTNLGKYLLMAVISAFIAYLTKTNAVITFGLVGVTLLVNSLPRILKGLSRLEWVSIGLFIVVSAIVVYRVLTNNIVSNASGLGGSLLVKNEPGNFLFFDIKTFLTEPYTDAWKDGYGREFFWNYLAKTSLFGEFKLLTTKLGVWLASFISFSFLVLCGFALRGFWVSKWDKTKILLMAQAVFFFSAMIVMRLKYPYSCSNDFRYIIPILLSGIPWMSEGISGDFTSTRLKVFGIFIVFVFSISSFILLLSL